MAFQRKKLAWYYAFILRLAGISAPYSDNIRRKVNYKSKSNYGDIRRLEIAIDYNQIMRLALLFIPYIKSSFLFGGRATQGKISSTSPSEIVQEKEENK